MITTQQQFDHKLRQVIIEDVNQWIKDGQDPHFITWFGSFGESGFDYIEEMIGDVDYDQPIDTDLTHRVSQIGSEVFNYRP